MLGISLIIKDWDYSFMAATILTILLILVISYLIGSIPPSYIVGKLFFKVDIREQGSGNVGGANSARLFGKKIGILVGLFDVFKGYFIIYIAKYMTNEIALQIGFFSNQNNVVALAGLLVIIGHCFSVFLKFSGGKGGATTAGVALALDPFSAMVMIIFWIVIVVSTRFTSLANLLAVVILPVMYSFRFEDSIYRTMGILIMILLYFTHRSNIARLSNGYERKFGDKEEIIQ